MSIFVDRSNNNGTDDYHLAHAGHVYVKITDGVTGDQSAAYRARVEAARRAGAVTGAYHFGQNNDPRTECDFFINTLVLRDRKPRAGDLRPMVDVEQGQTIGWVEAFATHFRSRLGYWPTLYGNTSTIEPMRQASAILRALPWCRAEYGPDDGQRHPLQGGSLGAAIHQYTSKARFPGIAGETDADFALRPDLMVVPAYQREQRVLPGTAWKWARWRLGIAEYHGHGGDKRLRPRRAPRVIPPRWWRAVRWYKRHVVK